MGCRAPGRGERVSAVPRTLAWHDEQVARTRPEPLTFGDIANNALCLVLLWGGGAGTAVGGVAAWIAEAGGDWAQYLITAQLAGAVFGALFALIGNPLNYAVELRAHRRALATREVFRDGMRFAKISPLNRD